jgi:hypothetical protein
LRGGSLSPSRYYGPSISNTNYERLRNSTLNNINGVPSGNPSNSNDYSPSNTTSTPQTVNSPFTIEQQTVLANKQAEIYKYRDKLRVDNESVPNPNKCKRKCFTYELPNHLGGNPLASRYATLASGSRGDFVVFTPKGDSAVFDGLVKPRGLIAQAGATTNRHVIEAKLWDWDNSEKYTRSKKRSRLNELVSQANYDLYVARQCKYTYSVVVSNWNLKKDFNKVSKNIRAYYIPLPFTPNPRRNS